MKDLEELKQVRRNKFLSEHPEWHMKSSLQYEIEVRRLKRVAKRLKHLDEILELRLIQDMTLQQIADKYGVTRQRIQQIISRIKK